MSNTGRYYIKKGERTFVVEPIDNTQGKGKAVWGDINPATKTIEGKYGDKNLGSVTESESIITKENGYKNIVTLGKGQSPDEFIRNL
jgi:hypothetical protein